MANRVVVVIAWFLGLVLVLSSIGHLQNVNAFFAAIVNYRIIDASVAWWTALTLPWLQGVLGVSLLSGKKLLEGFIVASVVFGLFLFVQMVAWSRGDAINCGCFGLITEETIGVSTLIRTGVFALVATIASVLEFQKTRDSARAKCNTASGD